AGPVGGIAASVISRSFSRKTRWLFPVVQSIRNTSEGQSNDSLNSITPSPKPAGESRTHVTWPNSDPVVASHVFPPSRVCRKMDPRGVSFRKRVLAGFIHSGSPEEVLPGGWFQPVMMPTFGLAKSIQL